MTYRLDPPPRGDIHDECVRCGLTSYGFRLCWECDEADRVEYADSVDASDLESCDLDATIERGVPF